MMTNGMKLLDDLLDELEVDISRVGQLDASGAERILLEMDQVDERISALHAQDKSAKAQEGQFEYLIASFEKNAKAFLHDIGGQPHLTQLRAQVQPPASRTWWFCDEVYRLQKRKKWRSILMNGGISLLVLLLLAIAYRTFLAPNPVVAEVYSLQLNAEQYLSQGDYQKALDEVDQALKVSPGDPGMLVLKGAIETKLGQDASAQADFQAAQNKLGNEQTFLLLRAQQWLSVGEPELALADAQKVVQTDSSSAQGYYYLGKAQAALQHYQAAMDAYQTASQLAETQGQTELDATIRISLALLMQSFPIQAPTPAATPTR